MNLEKVMKKFALAANITLSVVTEDWLDLCKESIYEIRRSLKDGVDEDANEQRLDSAAAILCLYKYTLYFSSRKLNISVGDGLGVATLTDRKSMLNAVEKSWKEMKLSIADLLKDPNFVFVGIN